VAVRGDVLASKRRVGFGADRAVEHFIVVQADTLNEVLDTTLVVPLDSAFPYYADYPGAVRVPAVQAGASRDRVAVLTATASVDTSRFEPEPVARLESATLEEIDRMLAVVLDLA
jgi:mRNA-degrading endonuclease toxin of MazEF toxin-antitoxin module